MATNYGVIAQFSPTVASLETFYTVPAGTEVILSTIVIANRAVGGRSFTIAIRPDGETLANKHYIAFNVPIAANDSTTLTLGVTLNASDVISVSSSVANDLSFNAFGALITP
jgi:hypothetical protein